MTFRQGHLNSLSNAPLDILVIGGGIVGAGVARDAALRGLCVGLIEQNDFASGTSSRSSRLLHGGIRYLSQGRVGLVREASVEKTVLHKIAPHLATPLSFVFPSYRGLGWPLWQLKIGVKFYDLLCSGKNLGRSTGLGKNATLAAIPGLEESDLRGAVRYYDGLTNDARLVIDTLRSAENAGAHVCNYVRFIDANRVDEKWKCVVQDSLTGTTLTINSRTIVNATGPWANTIPHSSVKLRCTKGIHIVIDRSRLRFEDAVVITSGKRILFIIPWGERAIIGTTDTDYEGPPQDVKPSKKDVDYLIDTVNDFFPTARLKIEDVISSWAGLRPLLADPKGNPPDISRSHEIYHPKPGWWDVAGGKLTTYRLMAEQTLDKIIKSDGLVAGPSQSASTPLLSKEETLAASGIMPPDVTLENVHHFCTREWVVHLDDLMIRRTSWHYYHRDAATLAQKVATWMAGPLGWSNRERDQELERYQTNSFHIPSLGELARTASLKHPPLLQPQGSL